MQTFLPLPEFSESLRVLDMRRLGKQRVEARQLLDAIKGINRWKFHPAAKMWVGFETALIHYSNLAIEEWIKRGYNNTMKIFPVSQNIIYPCWFGSDSFHASHRSNLLRKDFKYYSQFGWKEPMDLPYVWPVND